MKAFWLGTVLNQCQKKLKIKNPAEKFDINNFAFKCFTKKSNFTVDVLHRIFYNFLINYFEKHMNNCQRSLKILSFLQFWILLLFNNITNVKSQSSQ